MLEFITTGRGGRKVLLDGYCYVVDRKRGDVTYWRCEERDSCGGRLKTKDDVVQGTPSQHSHASYPARTAFFHFPQTTIYGCLFHFGQCLWREIQRCGLQSWYNAPDNALIVKSFFALSFIPICDVIDAFTSLVSSLDNDTDEILAPFLTYFETTWIGVVQRGRRRRPAFDIRIWNSVERTTEGLPRTTNSLEGWHRGFEQRLAIKHPSVCKLVAKLRKDQSDWELTIEMVMSGVELRKQKKKYQKLNARISSLVDKYNAYTTVDFLRAVAHNL